MNKGFVSIIIPVYNREDYLADCLDSIREQTWKDLEVIVVDDGSTDRSCEIVRVYVEQDARFHLYIVEHKGPSEARNQGIAAATGEFLTFVDADDLIGRDYIRNMAEAIGDADCCIAGYQVWNQKQNTWRTIRPATGRFSLTALEKRITQYESVLRGVAWKLLRRSVAEEHQICFPLGVRYAEDTLFFFRYLSCIETIAVLGDAQYIYRQHDQQSLVKASYQEIERIEQFFAELEKLYTEAQQDSLRKLIAYWQMLNQWEIGRVICYRISGFQNRKKCFFKIAQRYDLKRKCRQVKHFSAPYTAAKLTVLSHTFLPFNLFVRAVGLIKHWDKQFV